MTVTDDAHEQDHDTELTPTMQAPEREQVEAWSLDYETANDESPGHSRVVTAGLVALVAGVAATGIWLGSTFVTRPASKHVERSSVPTTTTTQPVAAPPPAPTTVTSTVTAAPPTTATPTPEQRDAQFVALVAPKLPAKYRDGLPKVAQSVCVDIAQGRSESQEVASFFTRHPDDDTLTWDGLNFFVTVVAKTPN